MPGPILTPTARPDAASDSAKDNGGEKASGSQIRVVPEVDVVRRAGSSQTPSSSSSGTDVASECTTVACGKGNEVDGGAGGGGLVDLDSRHRNVEGCQRHGIRAEAAAEIGHVADSCLGEALGVPGRDGESRGLFKARLGEQHLPGELAELALCFGAQPGLRQYCGHEFGGVPRLAEAGVEREGLVLPVRSQRRQELPSFLGEEVGDLVLRCFRHGVKPSGGASRHCCR